MEYIYVTLVTVGLIVFLIIKYFVDKRNDERRLRVQLDYEWGKEPSIEYALGKMESLAKFYQNNKDKYDIDNITWNDLDMDDLFIMLNNTKSAMGEEVLYKLLRKPLFNKLEIEQRRQLLQMIENNDEERLLLQKQFSAIGRDYKLSFYEFFSRLNDIKREKNIVHYIVNVVWVIAIIGIPTNHIEFIWIFIANLVISILLYYKRKSEIESYYFVFRCILRMLYQSKKLSNLNITLFKEEREVIRKCALQLKGFQRNSGIVLNPKGGNILDIILDYVRMLTHIDLMKFNNMLSIVMKKEKEILLIYEKIGYMDALISIVSFRKFKEKDGVCEPEFIEQPGYLSFEKGYHPFLNDPVFNDFKSDGSTLITGSNASGKSTFLKMISINAILAQTITTTCASSYKSCYYQILTSMALTDNIQGSQSYFIVEILSLKRILDANPGVSVLCCIDEVLRGTNTIERIAASSEILRQISCSNANCFAATHDIELAQILTNYYKNYHFQETIIEENVLFDYKIYSGQSLTRNAINLLRMLGYESHVVNRASECADFFEKNGTWNKI